MRPSWGAVSGIHHQAGGGQATISAACAAEQNVGRGPGDGPLGDLAASWSVTTGRVFTKERAGSPAGFS